MANDNNNIKLSSGNPEFQQVCDIIELHRTRALYAVNQEHLLTCWEVGAYVSSRMQSGKWGDKVVRALAEYIKHNLPELRGYGKSNLYNMVKFYQEYSTSDFSQLIDTHPSLRQLPAASPLPQIVQPMVGQIKEKETVQPTVGQMPAVLQLVTYTHHTIILNYCHTSHERLFYILYSNHERLNKRQLERVICTETFQNLLGGDKSNMSEAFLQQYPAARVMFKDRLMLDFLSLPSKHNEPKVHKAINAHMKEFLLEMGKEDLIFVQDEYPLPVGGKTFHLDFLFYHRILHCYVGVELKAGEYDPRDQGQLEFYLSILDKDIKRPEENPSVGILLCRHANKAVVEYALSKSMSPTMVAEYERILIPREVMQRSLDEFIDFTTK